MSEPRTSRRHGRILKTALLAVMATLVTLAAALWFLIATEAGLRTLAALGAARMGDELQFTAIEGRLAGPLHISGLQLRHAGGHVAIETLNFDWSPLQLLAGELRIEYLDLLDTRVVQSAGVPQRDTRPPAAGLQLPFEVSIRRALIHKLQFQDESRQLAAQQILLSARTQADQLLVETLQLDAAGLEARATGAIGLGAASDSQLAVQWQLTPQQRGAPSSTGALRLAGDLEAYRYEIDAAIQSAQIPATSLRARGNGNLQGLNIEQLQAELLEGSIAAGGRLDWQPQLRWDIRLRASSLNPGRHWESWAGTLSGQLSSAGSYSDGRPQLSAELERLEAELRGYAVTARADATVDGEQAQMELQWQLAAQQQDQLTSTGTLQLEGTPDAYRFNTRAAINSAQLPAGDWKASGEGDRRGIRIGDLQAKLLEGTLSGQGQLSWQPQLQWNMTLAAEQLDPRQHWPAWPGRLSARLASTGRYVDDKLRLEAKLTQLDGRLRGYPVSGRAEVAIEDTAISLRAVQLQSGNNHLSASGDIDTQLNLNATLQARDLSAVAPGLQGLADIQATLRGTRQQPHLEAQLSVADLEGHGLSMKSLQGQLDLHWTEKASQSLRLQASDISYAGYVFGKTTLAVSGPLSAHTIHLSSATGKETAEIRLSGGWDGQQWQGSLDRAQWDLRQTGAWTLERPVSLLLARERIQVPETCWIRQQSEGRLCSGFDGNPAGPWQAETRLQNLSLTMLDELLGIRLQWTSRLDGRLQAEGSGGRVNMARLDLDVSSGSLRYGDQSQPVEEQIQGMELRAVLDSRGVESRLHVALAGEDYLDVRMDLPAYQAGISPWKQQALSLSMRGRVRELAGLGYLVEDMATFRGSVDIDMHARGTLGQPVLSGGLSVQDGAVGINRLGIELRELQLAIHSERDAVRMRGSCRSGEGQLTVEGVLEFEDIARWNADVRLQGSDFEAAHIPEAVVLISPDLRVRIRPPAIDLQGELHVPVARLKPKQLPGGITVSRDVIVVDPQQPETPAERWKITSKLRLSLGERVTLDGFGVKGQLTGRLDLHDEPQRVTRARGKLAIEKGTYTVYGRELNIVKGQLLFSDGPVDNPGLDFDAERVIGDVHAGVRARGTLKEPELSLYSVPAMSDADIVSYITLGRPAAEAGQAGGSAADALALASGGYLAGSIGESLGLEEFKVESSGTLEEASLVLGTYLSPQLYVRYSAGLNETANRFEAIYELSKNWSVRTQTSQIESGADVIFSFER